MSSVEINETGDGLIIIDIIDSSIENAEKVKKKILRELGLKPIYVSTIIQIQVIAKRKLKRRKAISIAHV